RLIGGEQAWGRGFGCGGRRRRGLSVTGIEQQGNKRQAPAPARLKGHDSAISGGQRPLGWPKPEAPSNPVRCLQLHQQLLALLGVETPQLLLDQRQRLALERELQVLGRELRSAAL